MEKNISKGADSLLKKIVRLHFLILLLLPGITGPTGAQTPGFPVRAAHAPAGTEFSKRLTSLNLTDREREIYEHITSGNVPEFFRKFSPVSVTNVVEGKTNCATFFVAPDCLAVGSDEDYFVVPVTPATAQGIADQLGCTLPTRKMVNDIYAAAEVKLAPSPIPPGPRMTTVPVFAQHNAIVRTQRWAELAAHPLGALVAGDKKDVVITPQLTNAPGKTAIYGWHRTNGVAIQQLYLGHTNAWVDYSHGIRLVQQQMTVNGLATTVAEVLANPELAGLLSDEGVVADSRYPTNALTPLPASIEWGARPVPAISTTPNIAEFKPSGQFGEFISRFTFVPEVRVQINAPSQGEFAPDRRVLLILYALPNGNTIEQTIGHRLKPGDDWHFDIQHIGAQTRFLRQLIKDRTVVVAYLEAGTRSWPAWRKQHGDEVIPEIVSRVKKSFPTNQVEMVLTGHSGGGSFTFGYLNSVKEIPDDVARIAFLDSNYAYRATNHLAKLTHWLQSSGQHHFCVLAYNDAVAQLEGKSFVTAEGGTWGRSRAMLKDLGAQFQFTSQTRDGMVVNSALDGRIQFLLK